MNTTEIDARYRPAALEALASFPVVADRLEPVGVSENVSYRVIVEGSDTAYALRLHRQGYNSLAELESERAWVTALGDAGLAVQQALKTRDGRNFVLVDVPDTGEQRFVGMTTWLEGELLADVLERGVHEVMEFLVQSNAEVCDAIHREFFDPGLAPAQLESQSQRQTSSPNA